MTEVGSKQVPNARAREWSWADGLRGMAVAVATLAFVIGAFGALTMWFIADQLATTTYVPLVTVLLTLAGWFVNARLAEAAQERLFLHNIINQARLDIGHAITAEQKWIWNIIGLQTRYRSLQQNQRAVPPPANDPDRDRRQWLEAFDLGKAAVFGGPERERSVNRALEEYELLFPETSRVRIQLNGRHIDIADAYRQLIEGLFGDYDRREAVITSMEQRLGANMGYSFVLGDLRSHIQNASLSRITGRRIPPRQPKDPKYALMKVGADGLLDVVENGQSWPTQYGGGTGVRQ